MLFWVIIKAAFSSLLANKMRSVLAMLGIIIGVAAVISMLAIGAGAKRQVLQRISAMGTNLLVVRPGQRGTGGVMSGTQQNLTIEDAQAIVREIPQVRQLTPVVNGSAQIKFLNQNARVSVLGASMNYLDIRSYQIDRGRFFNEMEAEGMARVAVLGPTTAQNLMGQADPVGQTIKLNGINFRVVGVLVAKGDQGWFNPDDQVIIPYTTAMKQVFGQASLREIDIQAHDESQLGQLQETVTQLLRKRHRIAEGYADDFTIRNQADLLQAATTVTQTFTILLGSIAGISLLVGGIGIMNIMLVTVTERTREIGIRKAIGARDGDILRQFLIEAVLMSALGGLLGLGLGVGVAKMIAGFTDFQTIVQLPSAVLALSFSAAVGIFFGFYPARRAALLDPIEALRYE